MIRFLAFMATVLVAWPAMAAPSVSGPSSPKSAFSVNIVFPIGDTTQSQAIPVSGFCSVRYQQSGGDDASLYAVTTATTAAASGTLIKSFTSSTTAATTFTAGTRWVKAVATDATAGGSVMTIDCAPLTSGGGSASDVDGNGRFEVAYLWDADGDGSSAVTCTADAVPDIACKAAGEVVYRDTIDDVNCAIHDCGNGYMEVDGTLILGKGVFVGLPCWNASNPGTHTPENAEVNDSNYDATNDAAYANCAVDSDGRAMTVISLQDWGGTLLGSGNDERQLHRGLMDATTKRDRGTYLTNDMGPWHSSGGAGENQWFGGGVDFYRMVSAGFSTNVTNVNHHTGASSGNGDSKGWWKVFADADWETYGSDENQLCLRHTGGTVGTDYAAASTVTNLARGDTLLVPVKASSTAASYSYYEVRVRTTPSGTCGSGGAGIRVSLGGSVASVASATAVYPPFASVTLLADNVAVVHARSDYKNTNVTIANMSIEPQDYWNEVGSRCTNDTTNDSVSNGTAFRANLAASGTVFIEATDNANFDFSCDTNSLIGFWGGGRINLENVNIKNFHFYPLDGGSSGGTHIARNVRWMHGQGGPAWDSGNGWQVRDSSIEHSTFNSTAFSVLGAGFLVENLIVKNSVFSYLASLNAISEGSRYFNIRAENSQLAGLFFLDCGAKRNTFRDLYITGRHVFLQGSTPGSFLLSCSTTSDPITANTLDGMVVDNPDSSINNETQPAVLLSTTTGNTAAILNNTFLNVRAGINTSGGDAGEEGCIFGTYDYVPGGAAADGGESEVFTRNYFGSSSVPANGRVFCVSRDDGTHADITSSAGTTPSYGDPVGCGNLDGGVPYAHSRCNPSELGTGTRASVDFPSMTAGTCQTAAETVTLTGLVTTDSIIVGHVSDDTAQLGQLIITAWPTANTINFRACNPTAGTINPTATSLYWKAVR